MDALNEMTALNASVGAEAGQPFTKSNTTIINDNDSDLFTHGLDDGAV